MGVDMVIVVDISGSMNGTKMTKAKKSAKDMAEAIWKEQEAHNINTNIALSSFASDVIHYKNDGTDFSEKIRVSYLMLLMGLLQRYDLYTRRSS